MNLAIARRKPSTNRVINVRPLVPADLERLRERSNRTTIRNIRDRHHQLARLLASGLSNRQIAERLGYTESRVCVLKSDPSIVELANTYRTEVHEAWREQVDIIQEDALTAVRVAGRMLVETLEDHDEAGTRPSIRELIAISADRMDRFGYGKHQTNTNINVDFAKKLEAAISRSRRGEP